MCANISGSCSGVIPVFWEGLWSKIKWEMGFLCRLAWKRLSCSKMAEMSVTLKLGPELAGEKWMLPITGLPVPCQHSQRFPPSHSSIPTSTVLLCSWQHWTSRPHGSCRSLWLICVRGGQREHNEMSEEIPSNFCQTLKGYFFYFHSPPPLGFRIIFQEHICKSSKGKRTVSTRGWYTVFPLCTVGKIDKRNKGWCREQSSHQYSQRGSVWPLQRWRSNQKSSGAGNWSHLPRTRRRLPLTKWEQNSMPFVVARDERKCKKGILS